MRSHSSTFGVGLTRSSWSRNATASGSLASDGAFQVLRRGGRSPMIEWKRAWISGRDRNSISFHEASFCCDLRKITRLVPPAMPAPGPSGPGNAAVPHCPSSSFGCSFLNSRMFQGPEM
ncbi:hypothetical protein G6F68_014463 [Rhizopus microsporus]|nr:hypothetical protein G6F68_014463 [Rhizopus microsporus]